MGKLVDTIKGKIGSAVSSVKTYASSVVQGVKDAFSKLPALVQKALPVTAKVVSPVLAGSVLAASNIKTHFEGSSAVNANGPSSVNVAPQGNQNNTPLPLNTTNIALVLAGIVGLFFLARSS